MTTRIDLPVRAFIEQRIKENFPDFDFRRSTALNDLTANVFAMLIQPFRNELDNIKIGQSLRYYNLLDDQKIDDILFNLLVFIISIIISLHKIESILLFPFSQAHWLC